MKIEVEVPDYDPRRGIRVEWQIDCIATTEVNNGTILVRANQPGLMLLAQHLLALAWSEVPPGSHIHYDDMNFLQEGSTKMIIERM
jgi:hypothetical protein